MGRARAPGYVFDITGIGGLAITSGLCKSCTYRSLGDCHTCMALANRAADVFWDFLSGVVVAVSTAC